LNVAAMAGRAGTSRDQPRCAVTGGWRYAPPYTMLPSGDTAPLRDDRLKGTVAGVRESTLSRALSASHTHKYTHTRTHRSWSVSRAIPTRVAMDTPATPSCCCVSRKKRDAFNARRVFLHGFCAYGAPRRLRPNFAHKSNVSGRSWTTMFGKSSSRLRAVGTAGGLKIELAPRALRALLLQQLLALLLLPPP
jgi:hypothetical protein